jgi:thiol-disulfide isomerase/thioredoxin
MRTIQRVTTLVPLLLTVSLSTAAQDKQSAYEDAMRKGETLITRRAYEDALQAFKKAYALKEKSSIEAAFGMAAAYRGLAAHKSAFDISTDALKLAGGDKALQAKARNLRGAALASLSEKPSDKRLVEAESEFRTALEADPAFLPAQLNLGVTLLKMNRDEDGTRELKIYMERAPKGPETEKTLRMIEEPRRTREPYAPDFSFTTKQGEFIALEDLRGKTVVLDFWGTWCKPCVMATPGLVKLQKKYAAQPVVFVGIAVRDAEPQWAAYIDKNKMDWPQFLDTNRKVVTPFGVNSFPTYIVIDGDGIVRARKSGYGMDTEGWLDGEIKRTLKNK